MYLRSFGLGLLAAVILASATGCNKSAPTEATGKAVAQKVPTPPTPAGPPVETVARIHWLGMKQLAADTNAAYFISIWNLPESARLETETLDKLALAIWRLSPGGVPQGASGSQDPATNQPSTLNPLLSTNTLRPLLDDLVQEECYLEIRNSTNQPGELALAIRLEDQRAALWETNLAAAIESLTGARPAPTPDGHGWNSRITFRTPATPPSDQAGPRLPPLVSLTRSGAWTLLGLTLSSATNPPPAAPNAESSYLNSAVSSLLSQLATNGPPPLTNYWLDAMLDLPRVASALACAWTLPADVPRISLTLLGDGQNVRTRGQLDFPKPLPFELEPWNVPTNLIREPLVSFTAIQGLKPWLSSLGTWKDLQAGVAPNQVFFWAQEEYPFLSYVALPLPAASNCVSTITQRLLQKSNPYLETNGLGFFVPAQNVHGVLWMDLPLMEPFARSITTNEGEFFLAGLLAHENTNRTMPSALLRQVVGPTNLVCYDWEMSGPRIDQWLYFGQLFRYALHYAQIPPKGAAVAWLKALEYKLINCATVVTRTRADQLSFVRKSSIGLTAVELHWLADWLESPAFPRGLHTFLAPPDPLPRLKSHPSNTTSTNGMPSR
jgi:hypothetical protein